MVTMNLLNSTFASMVRAGDYLALLDVLHANSADVRAVLAPEVGEDSFSGDSRFAMNVRSLDHALTQKNYLVARRYQWELVRQLRSAAVPGGEVQGVCAKVLPADPQATLRTTMTTEELRLYKNMEQFCKIFNISFSGIPLMIVQDGPEMLAKKVADDFRAVILLDLMARLGDVDAKSILETMSTGEIAVRAATDFQYIDFGLRVLALYGNTQAKKAMHQFNLEPIIAFIEENKCRYDLLKTLCLYGGHPRARKILLGFIRTGHFMAQAALNSLQVEEIKQKLEERAISRRQAIAVLQNLVIEDENTNAFLLLREFALKDLMPPFVLQDQHALHAIIEMLPDLRSSYREMIIQRMQPVLSGSTVQYLVEQMESDSLAREALWVWCRVFESLGLVYTLVRAAELNPYAYEILWRIKYQSAAREAVMKIASMR